MFTPWEHLADTENRLVYRFVGYNNCRGNDYHGAADDVIGSDDLAKHHNAQHHCRHRLERTKNRGRRRSYQLYCPRSACK